MTCMFCGAHMTLVSQQHHTNTYICPECATEYLHEWTLPVFVPGTEQLTENGKYLLVLHSTLYAKKKEKVYKEMLARRAKQSIA